MTPEEIERSKVFTVNNTFPRFIERLNFIVPVIEKTYKKICNIEVLKRDAEEILDLNFILSGTVDEEPYIYNKNVIITISENIEIMIHSLLENCPPKKIDEIEYKLLDSCIGEYESIKEQFLFILSELE